MGEISVKLRERLGAIAQRNDRIRGDTVRPAWTTDGSAFSYARRTMSGVEYLLVDAATGVKRPLFDRLRLDMALRRATGKKQIDPAALQRVRPASGGRFEFEYAGRRWLADEQALALADLGRVAGSRENLAPDGTMRIVFGGHDLALLDEDGRSIRLTNDGEPDRGYGDFAGFGTAVSMAWLPPAALWSPDSQKVATMRADVREAGRAHVVQSLPPEGDRPVLHSFAYPLPGDRHGAKLELWFLDRAGGRVRAKLDHLESFAFNPLLSWPAWWSADGNHFHFLETGRDGHRLDLWRVDAATGDARRLVVEESPGAGRPRFGTMPSPHVLRDGRILWASEADGWAHFYLVDAGDPASRRQLTSGEWRVVSLLHVDEDAGNILFTAAGREPDVDPYYQMVYSVDLDGSNLRRLTTGPFHHDPGLPTLPALAQLINGNRPVPSSVSPDGRHFVVAEEAVDRPPVSRLYDRTGREIAVLETADVDASWPADMPFPEPFQVRALDGVTDLWGVLYKPPGFDPAQPYKVIDVIYGGPQMAVVPKGFGQTGISRQAEMLAAAGFVALVIDGPGTPRRSRDFSFRSYGRLENCGGLDDQVAAIRTLAAERPWMDIGSGVGLTGASGGGYATVRAMAEFPEFFTVGVSICGNHDLSIGIAQWAELYQGLDPELCRPVANAGVAAQIKGHLFLIQGEIDDNVHAAHMFRLIDALIKADADFDMLMVPNAGHEVSGHPYAARRTIDFFLRYLRAG